MPHHVRILAIACALLAAPLAAQRVPAPADASDDARTASTSPFPTPVLDARLLVDADQAVDVPRPDDAPAWADTVTRPRWRYPAIGAGVGVAAGVIHATAIMQGDYVGFPWVEPIILLPAAYGLAGAFAGLLIDSSERERAARRD